MVSVKTLRDRQFSWTLGSHACTVMPEDSKGAHLVLVYATREKVWIDRIREVYSTA